MRQLFVLHDQKLTAARAIFQTVATDEQAIAVFESHFTHALPYHRSSVCTVLGQIGPPAERFLLKIRAQCKGKEHFLRATAAMAAYHITGDANEALPTLADMIADTTQPYSRSVAIYNLGEMGLDAKPLLPKLRTLRASGDPNTRGHTAIAVKKIEKAIADAATAKAPEPDANP